MQQRMSRAGEAGLFLKVEVFGVRLFRPRLLALRDGEKVLPVLHPQNIAGMAGAEKHQSGQKTARLGEQVEQFLTGDQVLLFRLIWAQEIKEVPVPVPAPVDNVVAVVVLNLIDQPFAGDAVSQEMGDDPALRVNLPLKQPQQVAPLLARTQRTRSPRLSKDEQYAQGFTGCEFDRLGRRSVHIVDDADEEIALAQGVGIDLGLRDFPRHASESGGEVVFLFRGSRQLDAQCALTFGFPEYFENVLTEHVFGDAHADLGDRRRFFPFLNVEPEVISQVEKTVPVADGDGFEIRLAVSELRTVGVEQAELSGVVRDVGSDDQIEMSRHGN